MRSRWYIRAEMKEAVAAPGPRGHAPAEHDAGPGEMGDHRFAPRGIGKMDAPGLPPGDNLVAEIDQRLEHAVFRRIDVVVGTADIEQAYGLCLGRRDPGHPEMRQNAASALVGNTGGGDTHGPAAAQLGAQTWD